MLPTPPDAGVVIQHLELLKVTFVISTSIHGNLNLHFSQISPFSKNWTSFCMKQKRHKQT